MQLYHIILAFIISLVSAQEPISSLTPWDSCISHCAAIDICCISNCQGGSCPTGEQYDNAVHCASQCPLGTGTPRDVVEYARCRQNCVLDNYHSGTSSSTTSTSPSTATSTTSSTSTSTSTTPSTTSFSNSSSTTTSDWSGSSSSSPMTSTSTSTLFVTPSSSDYSSSDSGAGTATHTGPTASEASDAATVNANVNMGGVLVGVLGAILAWTM